jgi:hypothetical protein
MECDRSVLAARERDPDIGEIGEHPADALQGHRVDVFVQEDLQTGLRALCMAFAFSGAPRAQ